MLSDSHPDRDLEWTEAGVEGSFRFINKIFKLTINPPLKPKHTLNRNEIKDLSDLINDRIKIETEHYKFIDKVNSKTKNMKSLNTKIHIKAAEFDYTSIQGEKNYGKRIG